MVEIIKNKIQLEIYKPSNSSYRSHWFYVLKKDGKALHIVHNLQPLNAVTIKDSGIPPMIEQYAKLFDGWGCYGMFDLFVGFDQQALVSQSRDLTTFQTPLGTYRLTSILMGNTNLMQIFYRDTMFLLQEGIPDITIPFVDDIPVKGPLTRYKIGEKTYETIPENKGIQCFIWEHLQNVNRVIQRVKHAGGIFSGHKTLICVDSAIVVGHKCMYEGQMLDDNHVQKIISWSICQNLMEVRGFLGMWGQSEYLSRTLQCMWSHWCSLPERMSNLNLEKNNS